MSFDFDSDCHTFYNETKRKIKRRIKSFTDKKIIKLIQPQRCDRSQISGRLHQKLVESISDSQRIGKRQFQWLRYKARQQYRYERTINSSNRIDSVSTSHEHTWTFTKAKIKRTNYKNLRVHKNGQSTFVLSAETRLPSRKMTHDVFVFSTAVWQCSRVE